MNPPAFLGDHDVNEHLIVGVLRREPSIQFVRALVSWDWLKLAMIRAGASGVRPGFRCSKAVADRQDGWDGRTVWTEGRLGRLGRLGR